MPLQYLGMGTDCRDVRRIIHWGIPNTLEEYVQEIGQSGQGGEHLLYMKRKGGRVVSEFVVGSEGWATV